MSRKTLGLDDSLYRYLLQVSLRESPVLEELRRETGKMEAREMQIAPEQGQFMALLVRLIGARKIIELGVFTGYSSLWMASAMPADGKLVACDQDPRNTAIAQRYWEKAGLASRIELELRPAEQTLRQLLAQGEQGRFDLAFIDADKQNYLLYCNLCHELLRPGGLILIDNVLWSGAVADPQQQDSNTTAIRALNEELHRDPRFDLSLVPIADGLTMLRKRSAKEQEN